MMPLVEFGQCFDETMASVEYPFFDALHKKIESSFCVDPARQFYAGFSTGARLAYMLDCAFPDVLRAVGAIQGQQPLTVQGRFAPLSQPWGGQPARIEDLDVSPQPALHRYLDHWRRDFDYILLLDARSGRPGQAQLSPRDAELVADKGFAALYRVRHEGPSRR